MIQTIKPIAPDARDLGEIVENWFAQHRQYPWVILTNFETDVFQVSLHIDLVPWQARRNANGCAAEPRYAKGYEFPFSLVAGDLSSAEQTWFKSAISRLSHTHRLDTYCQRAAKFPTLVFN